MQVYHQCTTSKNCCGLTQYASHTFLPGELPNHGRRRRSQFTRLTWHVIFGTQSSAHVVEGDTRRQHRLPVGGRPLLLPRHPDPVVHVVRRAPDLLLSGVPETRDNRHDRSLHTNVACTSSPKQKRTFYSQTRHRKKGRNTTGQMIPQIQWYFSARNGGKCWGAPCTWVRLLTCEHCFHHLVQSLQLRTTVLMNTHRHNPVRTWAGI